MQGFRHFWSYNRYRGNSFRVWRVLQGWWQFENARSLRFHPVKLTSYSAWALALTAWKCKILAFSSCHRLELACCWHTTLVTTSWKHGVANLRTCLRSTFIQLSVTKWIFLIRGESACFTRTGTSCYSCTAKSAGLAPSASCSFLFLREPVSGQRSFSCQ